MSKYKRFRMKIPLAIYIYGPTKSSTDAQVRFDHDELSCWMYFQGNPAVENEEFPPEMKWTRFADRLVVEIEDEGGTISLEKIINENNLDALLQLSLPIVDRCLIAIRNFGAVPTLHHTDIAEGDEAKQILADWNVEIADENNVWTELLRPTKSDSLRFLLRPSYSGPLSELDSIYWSDVQEAIEDNLPIPPEKEFFANSIEHLRNKNFRYSLLEAIIGLEIVLTNFLNASLRINYGLSTTRVNKFLNPELGLAARVSALLNILLPSNEIGDVDLDRVLRAINLRNHIIHKSGRLPEPLSEKEVKQCIREVLSLVLWLARKKKQIEIHPELEKIAEKLYTKYQISKPFIWLGKDHNIGVSFTVGIIFEKPDQNVLDNIINDTGQLLKDIDKRFNHHQNLYIKFSNLMDTERLEWYQGIWQQRSQGKHP